jgi:hypothetical protein
VQIAAMRILPFLLAVFFSWSLPAGAQTYVSLAYGGTSCATWNSRKAIEGKVYEAWMLGFISSYNAYIFKGPNVFEGSDDNDLRGWVSEYCKQHLEESLDMVVRMLIEERTKKLSN